MSVEAFLGEPAFQLVERVVRLVARGVPVEVVADAEGPVGVVREVGELVEGPVQHGDAAERAQARRRAARAPAPAGGS